MKKMIMCIALAMMASGCNFEVQAKEPKASVDDSAKYIISCTPAPYLDGEGFYNTRLKDVERSDNVYFITLLNGDDFIVPVEACYIKALKGKKQ